MKYYGTGLETPHFEGSDQGTANPWRRPELRKEGFTVDSSQSPQ